MKSTSAENNADQAETSVVEEADSDFAREMAQETVKRMIQPMIRYLQIHLIL